MSGVEDAIEPWPYRPADAHGWPPASDHAAAPTFADELAKAQLGVRQKRTDQEIARAAALQAHELALEQAYHTAVLEVAKGSIDRSRAAAETVQKASAAIVTLYTGVLALAFSVSEHPLPARALIPAVLLGLAVVLSTGFLAYLPDGDEEGERRAMAGESTLGDTLSAAFVRWTRTAARQRAGMLRAGVVALLFAVALIPAPFLTLDRTEEPAAAVAWPDPAALPAGDLELQKILYTAQVAAASEAEPIADGGDDTAWWLALGVALACVLVAGVGPSLRGGATRAP